MIYQPVVTFLRVRRSVLTNQSIDKQFSDTCRHHEWKLWMSTLSASVGDRYLKGLLRAKPLLIIHCNEEFIVWYLLPSRIYLRTRLYYTENRSYRYRQILALTLTGGKNSQIHRLNTATGVRRRQFSPAPLSSIFPLSSLNHQPSGLPNQFNLHP